MNPVPDVSTSRELDLNCAVRAAERPKVSVCMAAYQGERYIADQLRSILEQLSAYDEVIVVDDHSMDRTREEIQALTDSRIRLIEHHTNRGIASTFQDALSAASGEVIFLSDQDDIWSPAKVSMVLQIFQREPEVTLVVTDAALIDEDGNRVSGSYYDMHGAFSAGIASNLVRCKFLGCLMAFRAGLLPKVLPFPSGCGDVLHDFWIGVVNSITSGTTRYLNEQLVFYRRHPAAVTSSKLNFGRKVEIRWNLLRAIIVFWARDLLARRVGT